MSRPQLVEPIDYETFIQKNRTILQNDPQRELLLYPQDDVYDRASSIGVGAGIIKEGFLLRGPESGSDHSFISLATKSFKRRFVTLKQEVDGAYILEFHKDDKKSDSKGAIYMDFCREVGRASKRGKYGFVIHLNQGHGVKSCVLAAESERESEDWIDTLNQVVVSSLTKSDSQRRNSVTNGDGIGIICNLSFPVSKIMFLYLQTQSKLIIKFHLLCSRPWTDSIPLIALSHSVRKIAYSSEAYELLVDPHTSAPYGYGTLKSLEHSKNPDLVKYSRETDYSITQERRENRQNLFQVYPNMPRVPSLNEEVSREDDTDIEPFSEKFGLRFLVKCENIQFRLQLPVEADRPTFNGQVEPHITSIALYNARKGVKISEDFCFDVNDASCQKMLDHSDEALSSRQETETRRRTPSSGSTNSVQTQTSPSTPTFSSEFFESSWLTHPKQVWNYKYPEIYLVVRIEKCLQGGISQAVEPYTRNSTDMLKLAMKVHKVAKTCCQRLKGHKQPMAWSARYVLLTSLSMLALPLFFLKFHLDCVTSAYLPVKPFTIPPSQPPTFEVSQFLPDSAKDSQPFSHYVNHLFIFPKSLKYEAQKIFVKARNIACVVEFRDSDEENAKPIKCIYKKCAAGGRQLFTSQAKTAVVHHNTCPDFYEQIKLLLPVHLHQRHHLLFTFFHISCETPKAKHKDLPYESVIGYTWLPILSKGRVNADEQTLPVSTQLPSGYLSCQALGLGKGFSGPDIRWVDGGKPVFRLDFKLVSTVNTKDQHLCNFFNHCQKLQEHKFLNGSDIKQNMMMKDDSKPTEGSTGSELGREMSKYVKNIISRQTCLESPLSLMVLVDLCSRAVHVQKLDLGSKGQPFDLLTVIAKARRIGNHFRVNLYELGNSVYVEAISVFEKQPEGGDGPLVVQNAFAKSPARNIKHALDLLNQEISKNDEDIGLIGLTRPCIYDNGWSFVNVSEHSDTVVSDRSKRQWLEPCQCVGAQRSEKKLVEEPDKGYRIMDTCNAILMGNQAGPHLLCILAEYPWRCPGILGYF
ncbi:Dedicator of cytokinesis protein 9 [Nymphon striatum]|nr:Dedicator of cytokinesis protein 9 [Nymphon striatum]